MIKATIVSIMAYAVLMMASGVALAQTTSPSPSPTPSVTVPSGAPATGMAK